MAELAYGLVNLGDPAVFFQAAAFFIFDQPYVVFFPTLVPGVDFLPALMLSSLLLLDALGVWLSIPCLIGTLTFLQGTAVALEGSLQVCAASGLQVSEGHRLIPALIIPAALEHPVYLQQFP
ncbi:hypothetical protein DSO57_1036594 [Entomophthora muscae]|uniref:Uncharacterized protein n=1 Tax=Entomophthora muscae TaxID=34485 RepID=A0ACC2S142_9FUNG|nr:hypothetical protein DSO57_1036594 [Entomophthora muscae]